MKKIEQLSKIIQDYVNAYNNFDVHCMIKNLHEDVIFKNISNDEVNLTTKGKLAFEEQALQAKQYFKTRQQSITNIVFTNEIAEISIDYRGIIAFDLPNGLKENDKIELQGKSIFRFIDNKIIEITDIS